MESILGLAVVVIALLGMGIWLYDRRAQAMRERIKSAHAEYTQSTLELNQARAELDLLAQNIGEGILLIDANERIVFANDAAKRILDLRDENNLTLDGIAWWLDLPSFAREVLSQHTESLGQTIVKDERAFHVSVRAYPAGMRAAAIVLIQEVTELQRLGRMRRDFVANISHELRTPVATLQLLVETLARETPATQPRLNDLVAKAQEQVNVLNQLAEEMMSLALIESGQMPIRLIETRVSDLVTSALDILRTQAEHKSITIRIDVSDQLFALADPTGIRKVLNNLLHNAIKFTRPQGQIAIRAQPSDDNILIEVSDTGLGIPARDLPRIFERFYKAAQTRATDGTRGTGLGLAIAKHIVEGHGGKIWAESVEGKGTTIYFTLPASDRR